MSDEDSKPVVNEEIVVPPEPKLNTKALCMWVAYLRTGVLKQGRNVLETQLTTGEREFCCLGVACWVAKHSGVSLVRRGMHEEPSPGIHTIFQWADPDTKDWIHTIMPEKVGSWFGFKFGDHYEVNPGHPTVYRYPYDDSAMAAATANDTERWPFAKIADEIEKFFKLPKPGDEDYPEFSMDAFVQEFGPLPEGGPAGGPKEDGQ